MAAFKIHLSLLHPATKQTRNPSAPTQQAAALVLQKGEIIYCKINKRGHKKLSREAGWHGQGESLSFQHCSLALYGRQGCKVSTSLSLLGLINSTSNIIPAKTELSLVSAQIQGHLAKVWRCSQVVCWWSSNCSNSRGKIHSFPSALSLCFHSNVPGREWWHRLQYWGQNLILQQKKYEIKSAVKATFYVLVLEKVHPCTETWRNWGSF